MAPPGCRMNRDEGWELSPLWLRMVKKMNEKVAWRLHRADAGSAALTPLPQLHHQTPNVLHQEYERRNWGHTHEWRHHPRCEDRHLVSGIGLQYPGTPVEAHTLVADCLRTRSVCMCAYFVALMMTTAWQSKLLALIQLLLLVGVPRMFNKINVWIPTKNLVEEIHFGNLMS